MLFGSGPDYGNGDIQTLGRQGLPFQGSLANLTRFEQCQERTLPKLAMPHVLIRTGAGATVKTYPNIQDDGVS